MDTVDLDTTITRAKALVGDPEPRTVTLSLGEAQKSDRIRQLREAERMLRQLLSEDPEHPEASVLFAEVASQAEDWDEAIIRWNKVAQRLPEKSALAHFKLAIAYRTTGSFHRARQALQQIMPGHVDSHELLQIKRKLAAREAEVAARIVGNRYLKELNDPDSERSASSPLLAAVLSLRNDAPHVAHCISDVAAAVENRWNGRAKRRRSLRIWPMPRGGAPRCVFVCGFGWSGSGAVYDYFSQSDVAIAPFGRAEILAFERSWSAKKLLNAQTEGRAAATTALTNFLYQAVLGVGGPLSIEADRNKRKSVVNFFRHSPEQAAALSAACVALYEAGVAAIERDSKDALESALREFFDSILSAKIKRDQVGLMGNCIHAANVDLVRLVSNAKAFVVFRDPRDQYVSQVYEHRERQRMTCDRFIAEYKLRQERFHAMRTAHSAAGRILPVRFEEFVLSARTRESVADEMGIPLASIEDGGSTYHPTDSIKNIGIHKSYGKADEIRQIEAELGDSLYEE
jgi:hypothetical protein